MVWTFGMMALRKADLTEFFAEFTRFTIFTGFYWWLLTNGPAFADAIYSSLKQIGSSAGGLGGALTPSSIVDIGFEILIKVFKKSSIWSPVDSMAGLLLAAAVLTILALVAVNMLLLLTSGWILAYAGVFFLGFGGSKWTSDMAINYYKTVLGIGAQLMTMVLIVGIGKTFINDYYMQMDAKINLNDMAVMLVVAIILLALVNKVPALVGGVVTGAGVNGIGNLGAGAAMAAATGASAAMGMAAAGVVSGAKNIAGGVGAVMAAISKASASAQSGSDSGGGESSDNGGAENGDSGKTPFAQAGGFSNAGVKESSGSSGIGRAGKIAAGTVANLASGAFSVGKEKFLESIHDTVGGQIAAAIKGEDTPSDEASSFSGNSLSSREDAESEVSAFVNRDNQSQGTGL
jgi:type IV secretion system protein VirB6/type IV secretion system protein TrbL